MVDLFFAGITFLALAFIKERLHSSIPWLIITLWIVIPIAAVVLLHSNHYEDGRHLFFIMPAFLLIGTFGMQKLFLMFFTAGIGSRVTRFISTGIFLITAVYATVFLFTAHPYQYAYFNAIGRKYAMDYFEKDYWGLSYRNALEFLVKYVPEGNINVNWKVDPCEWNLIWLSDHDQERIHIVREQGEFDYYITNYRSERPVDASDKKIYEIKVQGITIMAVYKMN
ncbi:MAG: hypothetical protein H0V61_02505 [Chitinophagales bacterium]|nr:hypothetical protein [Chitinophagales bacterium]